jgi:long-chain acyl-CoA synthetase
VVQESVFMLRETFTQHFLHQAESRSDQVALRQKEFGIWREFSWRESHDQVQAFAMGLKALGMERGGHVAAIGDNDREYLWGYLGVLALGGVMACLFTDASADEAAYIIHHSDARFVLAQDQEQVDKMLEIRPKIPNVQRVIYWEENGLWGYDDPWLIAWPDLLALGQEWQRQHPFSLADEIALGRGDDLALLSYTSGTTGLPKGAMLTHANLMQAATLFSRIDPRLPEDNHVSFLPLGWIAEHVIGFAAHCYNGVIVNFPEEPETVQQNVREISPQAIVYNSRLWDNLVGMIQVRMLDATWFSRLLFGIFVPLGTRIADKKMRGEPLNLLTRLAGQIGEIVFYRPLRDKLGLVNVRTALTGGSALSPDVMRFFHAIGVNLKQVYGSTEVATVGATHRNGDIRFASVGQPVDGVDIAIAEDGEIRIASPTLFRGYYKDAEKTAESLHVDSAGKRWLRTGDAGYIDEAGHLIYLDRVKDMITLSNGERFSPQFIEGRLKFNPYVKDVMALGDPTRDSVTALVIIDFDNIGKWAEKRNLGYTTFADLSQKEEVRALIRQAVEEVNSSLPPAGRLQAFALMHKEFDADESEMTRSRKLRRNVLAERYAPIIEALYGGQSRVLAQSVVTYQDGSSRQMETELHIVRMQERGA